MTDLRAQAQALEQAGDVPAALAAYERAFAATPHDVELLADLGRLARRQGVHGVAEAFYAMLLGRQPDRLEAVDGLTRALRDQHRYAEAIAVVRPAIEAHPADARLWNTLGTVLNQQGDSGLALTFFEEAVRLDPALAAARYNRGDVLMNLGRPDAARAAFEAAQPLAADPPERAMIAFAAATARLAQGGEGLGGGDLGPGWDLYEARLSPDLPSPTMFDIAGQRWTPDTPLAGRSLLVVAEQGLGDEVMFAGVLPDVREALGPEGRLTLAVEPRLAALFRRSFPDAGVVAHLTRREGHRGVRGVPLPADPGQLWSPLGSLPRGFRRSAASFPHQPYLVADPERVAHWKGLLAAESDAPWIGLTWRSGSLAGQRRRHYPPLEHWAPVLRTPGVRFVNLQYGAEPAEIEALERMAGTPILQPPGFDLRADLDELCALAMALDLAIAVPNATAALSAACGMETWFIGGPGAWPRLGTDRYPWYAHARSFAAESFGDFAPVLARVAEALTEGSAR